MAIDDYESVEDEEEWFLPLPAAKAAHGLTAKALARREHMRPQFLCRVCIHLKSESGGKICAPCEVQLQRLKNIYTEAAAMVPAVRDMSVTEFFSRLWEKEKERRGHVKGK